MTDLALADSALRLQELQLISHASNYDLSEPSERDRSTVDLANFYFDLVQYMKPPLFIEAGAKDASSSRRARSLNPEIRAVAFEANPYTFEKFKSENSAVEYTHMAVSDHIGEITFQIQTIEGGKPVPLATGRNSMLRRVDPNTTYLEAKVACTTLDAYFPADKRSCLWIDVEGANRSVLRGGDRTLKNSLFLLIEVEDKQFWVDQWLSYDVSDYLWNLGLIPVARDFQSRHQYNLLFVNKSLLRRPIFRRELAKYFSIASRGRKSVGESTSDEPETAVETAPELPPQTS